MMPAPETLPMHLMLAMLQSGIWPAASTPWSASWPSFMPEWLRPKSPLEQSLDQASALFQQASDAWLEAFLPKSENARNEASPRARPADSRHGQSTNSREAFGSGKRQETPAQGRGDSATFDAFFANSPFPQFLNSSIPQFPDSDFLATLGAEAFNRSTGFLQGLQAYLTSDYERPPTDHPVLWQRGNARLLDLAPEATEAVAVLCVPSLINTATILDLYPEVSFAAFLKARGFRPLILDWGRPGDEECEFAMADYISCYALDALETLRQQHDGPIALLGYCMGGIFTVAMSQLAARLVDALILLATPWDFSSPDTPVVLLAPSTQATLRQWILTQYPVQPVVTQTLFHLIDPWRVQEKFSRYPTLSKAEQRHFLAVEQWVNDGVPLANKVAEECFVDWPHSNILARHQWKIGRRWIDPEHITCPTLAVIPTKDAIVPKGCALPLTRLIPRCETLLPECGHVSLVVGKHARTQMWEPVANWLDARF